MIDLFVWINSCHIGGSPARKAQARKTTFSKTCLAIGGAPRTSDLCPGGREPAAPPQGVQVASTRRSVLDPPASSAATRRVPAASGRRQLGDPEDTPPRHYGFGCLGAGMHGMTLTHF